MMMRSVPTCQWMARCKSLSVTMAAWMNCDDRLMGDMRDPL
jgi:hypothetical protein